MSRICLLLLSLIFLWSWPARAALHAEAIEYHDGETLLEGYLAYDDALTGKRPGVLVVHEWKGLNDYAKGRAEQLAGLGYIAFALDMYGKGIYARDHEEARRYSAFYRNDRSLMRRRAAAGLEVLRGHPLTDPSRLAAIGYCFGGTAVLELARAGTDLRGVASFHGSLKTPSPAEPGAVRSKVLVMHGDQDPNVPAEQVQAFQDEMRRAGVDWQFVSFGGAVHAFTVPDAGSDLASGAAYHEAADRRSLEILKLFLKEVFA